MTEAIYKVGDILEFTEVVPRQFGLWAGPVRGLVIKISDFGYEYLSYRLLLSGTAGTTKNMTLCYAFEKDIIPVAKRIGHIDISALMFMENDEPDYENLRKSLAEETLKRIQTEAEREEKAKENERLSYENSDLKALNDELRKSIPEYNKLILKYSACTEKIKKLEDENKALSDSLSKLEAKAQSRLDRNEVLKRENEEVRGYNKKLEQALSKSEEKAHSRLDEISFLTREVNELENVRDKLKTERDEANHEIDRLRTVVGELNDVINDLNASKSEFSDLFYSLKIVLQTNDILEGVNKLKNENERLSNAQRYLDLSNENRELKAEYFACTEKIKELENENARYWQSMTCAEKQMTEATKRIHAAMEHLDVAVCRNE